MATNGIPSVNPSAASATTPTATNHQSRITSRPRTLAPTDLEASATLTLGEFASVPSLTISEARLVVESVLEGRRKAGSVVLETEVLSKTQTYLDTFSRFKSRENIEAVEQLLAARPELESFERSQLGTLCCESAEEAKTLIPSLQVKIGDAELEAVIREVNTLRESLG